MAAFDLIQNMYDISLKPRLLRSLIKEYIPDDKHPFPGQSEISHVLSTVKTHRLLSESATGSTDQKLIDNWKSAVDAWVNRLSMLVSSNLPDRRWAGISFLGVTCQECCSERFLASYSVWFQKLVKHIQPPEDVYLVKLASCASLSDLFTRLAGFPNGKKDGTSLAAKLIQPVLKLLNEDCSSAVWEGAVCLLCTIITFFPSSIHRHYDSAEAAIFSKITSGKCNDNMLKNLGHCLALLPKSRGDVDSWSLMMQKILLSIHVHLNDAFQGLEEETIRNEAMKLLVPPGKGPPPPLGGQKTLGNASDQAIKRPERLLMSIVSTLMLCCCTMLSSSYPARARVPVQSILSLAGRVLMVDGSVSQALFPFMTAMQQEFICSQLPVLHSCSLELLTSVVKGMRSTLLPELPDIMRILTEYFRKCAMPELRIKVYSIVKILLTSTGVGAAIYLFQEVLNSAFVDLDSIGYESIGTRFSAYSNVSTEALLQSSVASHKKRKRVNTTGSLEEQPDRVGLKVEMSKNQTPKSVKIAALEALEALLTVGGTYRSESWRSNIDHLLITVATNACKGGWGREEKYIFLSSEPGPGLADFQLAALRALLASFLSPARVRPPYLAQGLELFRRGRQETGTKLAEFCAHAVLTLEVLVHPRALSLLNFPSANYNSSDGIKGRFPEIIHSTGQKQNTPFSSGALGKGSGYPDSDDDLYKSWLRDTDEIQVPGSETVDPSTEKLLSMDGSSSKKIPEENELGPAVAVATGGNVDSIMVKSQQFQELNKQSQEPISQVGTVAAAVGGSTGAHFGAAVSDNSALEPMGAETTPEKDVLASEGDGAATVGGKTIATISDSDRGKAPVSEVDDELSTDSIPDIVDGDPDSD